MATAPLIVSRTRTNTHILESPFHGTSCYSGRLSRLPARAVRFHVLAPPDSATNASNLTVDVAESADSLSWGEERSTRLRRTLTHARRETCVYSTDTHISRRTRDTRTPPLTMPLPSTRSFESRQSSCECEHRDSSLSRIIRRRTKVELLTQKTTE